MVTVALIQTFQLHFLSLILILTKASGCQAIVSSDFFNSNKFEKKNIKYKKFCRCRNLRERAILLSLVTWVIIGVLYHCVTIIYAKNIFLFQTYRSNRLVTRPFPGTEKCKKRKTKMAKKKLWLPNYRKRFWVTTTLSK